MEDWNSPFDEIVTSTIPKPAPVARKNDSQKIGYFDRPSSTPRKALKNVSRANLSGPYSVTNSATIMSGGIAYRLAFVEKLERDDVCANSSGRRFSCGLMGRASLQNLIRDQEILCNPVFYPEEQTPRYQCMFGDTDLSRHQIAAGYAMPDALGLRFYSQDLTDARLALAGAWDGNWNVVRLR